jgi:membrane protein
MTKLERILVTRTPLALLIRKSKHWYLPGFKGVPLYDVVKFFRKQIKTTGLSERASAIAFNFVMSLPPAFLFLFTIIPHLPFFHKKDILAQLNTFIRDIIPAEGYNGSIYTFIKLNFFGTPKFGLISFGLILALFFASNAMMGIMRSFNKNYVGFARRHGLEKRWVAIKLTSLLFGLVLACFILLLAQSSVLNWLNIKNKALKDAIVYGRWVFIIALIFFSIAFIYKYAPAVHKRWKILSPGSILATTLSFLATWGFSGFVNSFGKYNILYGAIGTVIVIMAIIFINSLVLLIGFELNVSINSLKHIAEERETAEKITVAKQNP